MIRRRPEEYTPEERERLRREKFTWKEGDLRFDDPELDRLMNPSLYENESAPKEPDREKSED